MIRHKKVVLTVMLSVAAAQVLGASGDMEAVSLKEVTVTANKMEESLKDVPQSISVIDEFALQDRGIKSVGEVIKEIPNLSSTFLFSENINFRGVNASTFTNNNPVVLYIDGIPQSNRIAYDASLANVERIEVLRGPQGALYGKDSIGGVINIVTKTPQNKWSGAFEAEYGNYGSMTGMFNVGGAVVKDKFFVGINGKLSKDDGWIKNNNHAMDSKADTKEEQRYGVNFLFKPTDKLTLRAALSSETQRNDWVKGGVVAFGKDPESYKFNDFKNANFEQDTYTKTTTDSQSLSVNYKFDGFDIDSVTTRKKVDMDGDYDFGWDNNPLYAGLKQFQFSTIETTTQELRASGKSKSGLKWVGGAYYENEEYKNDRYGMQYPGAFLGTAFNVDMDDVSKNDAVSSAMFGQIAAPLGDKYELTVGARYQNIDKKIDSKQYMQPVGTTGAPPSIVLNADHKWNAVLPKIALSYKLNKDWNIYGSVSKGYMPGGFNYWTSSQNEEENRFEPQTSVDYEFGVKGGSGGLYLAANLFYMDIRDIHVYVFDSSTGMIKTGNAGKAHSQGAEIELNYNFRNGFEINGAVGLVQAVYDDHTTTSVNNNKIERTPSHTAKFGMQYNDKTGYYGRFDIRNQGSVYFNSANSLKEKAYTLADAKIGYRFSSFDIYGYIKNLADTSYISDISEQSVGNLVSFGDRRRFGIGARYTF